MRTIDLNCDMGESFGRYTLGADADLMPLVTSAAIACGMHGGDPLVMERTVALAAKHGVAIGAHPGYPDLQGFGRRAMDMTPAEVEALIAARLAARAEKNWAESDRIRDQLTALGVVLEDGKGGTTWRLAE